MKTITTDPVCGMDVEDSSGFRAQHGDELYLFCSAGCRRRFLNDPGEFVHRDEEDKSDRKDTHDVHQRQKGRGAK